MSRRTPVVIIHDGAVDEYMSTMLLLSMPNVDVRGVIVVAADCIGVPGFAAAWKLQQVLERPGVPVALSEARGLNPFPWEYRTDCISMQSLAALNPAGAAFEIPEPPNGEKLLAAILEDALRHKNKVTLLITCPPTPLKMVLESNRRFAQAIERVVWMGGAVHTGGNISPSIVPDANPNAEWNAFWDPPATEFLLQQNFPVVLFPLDVTNSVPVSGFFMNQLKTQLSFECSALAFASYQIVLAEPGYSMWDVVTTAYLERPDLFGAPQKMGLKALTSYWQQGRLVPDAAARPVEVVLTINTDAYYDYVLTRWRSNFSAFRAAPARRA